MLFLSAYTDVITLIGKTAMNMRNWIVGIIIAVAVGGGIYIYAASRQNTGSDAMMHGSTTSDSMMHEGSSTTMMQDTSSSSMMH